MKKHERVWVRARVGAGARASLPVRTGAQAEAWIRWWIDERDMHASDFMVSEMLPGREFAYQSVWQDGELVAGQARERVEYLYGHLTPSGQTSTPAVARTVDEPAVDDLAIRRNPRARPGPSWRVLRRHQGVGERRPEYHRDQRRAVLHHLQLLRGRRASTCPTC